MLLQSPFVRISGSMLSALTYSALAWSTIPYAYGFVKQFRRQPIPNGLWMPDQPLAILTVLCKILQGDVKRLSTGI